MDGKWKLSCLFILLFVLPGFLLASSCSLIRESEERSKNNKNNEARVKENVFIEGENVGGFTRSEVLEVIERHASKIDRAAKDAAIDELTWNVTEEKEGVKVNVEKTLEKIMNAEEGQRVKLVIETVYPSITAQKLKNNITRIAEFSTPIVDKSEGRTNNIELAAEKINNKVIQPGEEFSFNETVGERTDEEGYEYAPIIIKTEDGSKKVDGLGGGVCQLSTTLYQAVEQCGLEVTERHPHTSDVTYISKGEDAAVSYGYMDFKFVNNREYPIMIKVYLNEDEVKVLILENRNIVK